MPMQKAGMRSDTKIRQLHCYIWASSDSASGAHGDLGLDLTKPASPTGCYAAQR